MPAPRPPDTQDAELRQAVEWLTTILEPPYPQLPEPSLACLDMVVWEALAYCYHRLRHLEPHLKEHLPVILLDCLFSDRSAVEAGLMEPRGKFPHVTNTPPEPAVADVVAGKPKPQRGDRPQGLHRVAALVGLVFLSWCIVLGFGMTVIMAIGFWSSLQGS